MIGQRQRREHDGHAEQPPPGEAAQHAQPEEHAERQPEEDGREHRAPARRCRRRRVFLTYDGPSPTTTPPAANAPVMPTTMPRTTWRLAEELPAFPDRLEHRRESRSPRMRPAAQFAQREDRQRGHHERDRVEVQRQVDLVGREVVRDMRADRARAARTAVRRSARCRTCVNRLSWLACSSLSGGTRFGTDASLAGVQNSDAHEARNWTTYIQVSWLAKPTDRLIGMVRYSAALITSPMIMFMPAVELVGDRAGQRPEEQRRQQRGQPDAADRVRAAARAAELRRQGRTAPAGSASPPGWTATARSTAAGTA